MVAQGLRGEDVQHHHSLVIMAEILKRAKPLAVSQLKVSQPVGASLAFLGLRHAIPMIARLNTPDLTHHTIFDWARL